MSLKNATTRTRAGTAMTEALQINFALWGMIICAAIKISHMVAAF